MQLSPRMKFKKAKKLTNSTRKRSILGVQNKICRGPQLPKYILGGNKEISTRQGSQGGEGGFVTTAIGIRFFLWTAFTSSQVPITRSLSTKKNTTPSQSIPRKTSRVAVQENKISH